MKASGVIMLLALTSAAWADGSVTRLRDGGLQPQVVVDAGGTIHTIYLKGDPAKCDILYRRSKDGAEFSEPIRVNSQAGSAIAIGTIRGPQMAAGRDGNVFVVWNGSSQAEPKGPRGATPFLFARLNKARDAFEPEQNLITGHYGIDGGGSVAADREGHVYVGWHAPATGKTEDEASRRVWVRVSSDDGGKFGPEIAASDKSTGVCACCALKIYVDPTDGAVQILYRSASAMVNRDTFLLTSRDCAQTFRWLKLHPQKIGTCVMSTYAMQSTTRGLLSAWETSGHLFTGSIKDDDFEASVVQAASKGAKHPTFAVNARGETLLVWSEGAGWQRGGSVAWQVFDRTGAAVPESIGRAEGLPAWSMPAAFAKPDGNFVVMY